MITRFISLPSLTLVATSSWRAASAATWRPKMPGYAYHDIVPKPKLPHIALTESPRRLIVIGDVHGCLDEVKELLDACAYNSKEGDRVLFVGDLVNKGPLSLETVQYARLNNVLSIRGNHDDFALCLAMKLVPSEDKPPTLAYLDQLTR